MATHRSAEKRHRQAQKRYTRNKHVRSTVRNAVRQARAAAASRSSDAAELFIRAERLLRQASTKGVFHPKTTSRTVSRLHKALRASQA